MQFSQRRLPYPHRRRHRTSVHDPAADVSGYDPRRPSLYRPSAVLSGSFPHDKGGSEHAERRGANNRYAERLARLQHPDREKHGDEDLHRADQGDARDRAVIERGEITDLAERAEDTRRELPSVKPRDGGTHRVPVALLEQRRREECEDTDNRADHRPEERVRDLIKPFLASDVADGIRQRRHRSVEIT